MASSFCFLESDMKANPLRRRLSPAPSVAVGGAVNLFILLALTALFSCGAMLLEYPMRAVGALSLAVPIIAGGVSGILLPRLMGGGILLSFLSSTLAVLILLCVGLIIGKGHLSPGCPLSYMCYLAISVSASLLSNKRRSARRSYSPARRRM